MNGQCPRCIMRHTQGVIHFDSDCQVCQAERGDTIVEICLGEPEKPELEKLPQTLWWQMSKADQAGSPWLHYGERWEALIRVVADWNRTRFEDLPINKTVLDYMNDERTPKAPRGVLSGL